MFDMQLGEIAPGGVGSGLYGMLVLAVITVFIAGLMSFRHRSTYEKRSRPRNKKFASLYFPTTPIFVLTGTALALALPGERAGSHANHGAHGLSEVLYALTSARTTTALGIRGDQRPYNWYNTALGITMLGARFVPMIFVLGLRGRWQDNRTSRYLKGRLRHIGPCSLSWPSPAWRSSSSLYLPARARARAAREGLH